MTLNTESLLALGLTDAQAAQVMESLNGAFVPKARFNEINTPAFRRQGLPEGAGRPAGSPAQIQRRRRCGSRQITQLQADNAAQQKQHAAQLRAWRLDNAGGHCPAGGGGHQPRHRPAPAGALPGQGPGWRRTARSPAWPRRSAVWPRTPARAFCSVRPAPARRFRALPPPPGSPPRPRLPAATTPPGWPMPAKPATPLWLSPSSGRRQSRASSFFNTPPQKG